MAGRLVAELGMKLVIDVPPGALVPAVPGAVTHASGVAGLIFATRRAAAVLGVDSGPMHLAAALGKPGVAIFGPTDPARNGPCGGSIRVLRGAGAATTYKRGAEIDASMKAVTPEQVFEALRAVLRERRGDPADCPV
jgi:heptosyltransferase I